MRKRLIVPFLVSVLLGTIVFAQDKEKDKLPPAKALADDDKEPAKPKRGEKKEKPELEDALRRAYKKVRLMDEYKTTRFTVIHGQDDDEGVAVICVVEFGTGDLGLYLGSKAAAEKDQWIFIEKAQMPLLEEAAHRLR